MEIGSFLTYEDKFSRHVYFDYDSDIGNSQSAIRQSDDTICTEAGKNIDSTKIMRLTSLVASVVNQNRPNSDQEVFTFKVLSFVCDLAITLVFCVRHQ